MSSSYGAVRRGNKLNGDWQGRSGQAPHPWFAERIAADIIPPGSGRHAARSRFHHIRESGLRRSCRKPKIAP